MVCSRQLRSFQGVHPHGRPDRFRGSFISSRRPLIVSSIPSSVATDLPALFPRELRRQSEIHLHSWFAKHHKNKPTQKKIVRLDDRKDYGLLCVLCLLTCVPLSQENSVDGQKLTPTLGSPNATKTNPPKKNQSSRMTGWIKGCSVCCVCATTTAATKTNPLQKSLSLCCVCATTTATTKTNPPKKKTVRLDDGTDLGLL